MCRRLTGSVSNSSSRFSPLSSSSVVSRITIVGSVCCLTVRLDTFTQAREDNTLHWTIRHVRLGVVSGWLGVGKAIILLCTAQYTRLYGEPQCVQIMHAIAVTPYHMTSGTIQEASCSQPQGWLLG